MDDVSCHEKPGEKAIGPVFKFWPIISNTFEIFPVYWSCAHFLGGVKVVIRTESKYFILCECGGCIKPLSSEYITIMAWPILFKKQFFYNAIP